MIGTRAQIDIDLEFTFFLKATLLKPLAFKFRIFTIILREIKSNFKMKSSLVRGIMESAKLKLSVKLPVSDNLKLQTTIIEYLEKTVTILSKTRNTKLKRAFLNKLKEDLDG